MLRHIRRPDRELRALRGAHCRSLSEHLEKYPESPWAGEAMLHLAMDAMHTGRPAEAQARLQALLDVTVDDPADPTWEIRCKAKGTWADLDLNLGQYESAIPKLEDMIANDTSLHRRTWASMWLTQARLRLGQKTQNGMRMLRACGSEALGLVLVSLDKKSAARRVEKMAPPHQDGFSLEEIARIAARNGVPMRGFRIKAAGKVGARAAQLTGLPLPLILHYDMARYASIGGKPAFGLARGGAAHAFAISATPSKATSQTVMPHCPACPPSTAPRLTAGKKAASIAFRVRSVGHFVVVRAIDAARQSVTLEDPLADATYQLSFTQLEREWSGAGLMLERGTPALETTPAQPENQIGSQVRLSALPQENGFQLLNHQAMAQIRGGCCCPWIFGPTGPPDPGPYKPPVCNGPVCSPKGAPVVQVNPVSMNTYIQDIPVWYDTPIGPDVAPTLSYNSQDTAYSSSFGNNWRLNYEASIMENPGGIAIVNEGTGKFTTYRQTATGGYAAPTGTFNTLTKTGSDHFEVTEPTGEKMIFDKPRDISNVVINVPLVQLQEVRDRFGYGVQVRYQSFTQNVNGTNVTSVRLAQLIDAQGKITVFQYDTNSLCTAIVITNTTTGDVNSPTARRATFNYTLGAGRTTYSMTGVEDMGGNPFSYVYDTDGIITDFNTEQGKWTFEHRYSGHDPFRPTENRDYDNQTKVTDPQGGVQTYAMNLAGSPYFLYTDANNNQVRDDYSNSESPANGIQYLTSKEIVGQTGRSSATIDTATNQINSFTDENGDTSRVTYNWRGRPTSMTTPLGQKTTYIYDTTGLDVLQIKNDRGNTVMNASYTAYHQPDTVTVYPTASATPAYTTSYTYTAWGAPATVINPSNETTTYNYDSSTKRLTSVQVSSTTMGAVTVATLAYDSLGRVLTSTDAYGLARTYEYNDLDKPVKVTYPDGSKEVTDYVCCAIPGVTTDRSGRKTYRDYDELKRLRRVQDAEGNTLQMDYDKVGNLKVLIDSRGSVTRWDYDARNRVIRKTYMDGNRLGYAYDDAGQLIRSYDPRGVTKYEYDDDGHLTKTDYANSTDETFGYDDLGRRTSMGDSVGSTTWSYDNLGHMLTDDGPYTDDGIVYTYDAQGRRASMSVNGATATTYNYDSLGRLDTLVASAGTWDWNYNGNSGLPSLLVAPNGTRTVYSYDTMERLTGVSNRKSDATTLLSSYGYVFDNTLMKDARWKLTRQNRDTSQTLGTAQTLYFGYDDTDQLESETSNETNPLTKLARTFDPMGNMATSTDQGRDTATTGIRNISQTFANNHLNQLRTVSTTYTDVTTGTNTLTYDARGNLTLGVDTKSLNNIEYAYDDTNRLLQVLSRRRSDNVVLSRSTFAYDGLSRKKRVLEQNWDNTASVWKNVRATYFAFDGMDVVRERDENWSTPGDDATKTTTFYTVTRVGNIGGILARTKLGSPDRNSFYAYDGCGNVATVTDSSQNVQCAYAYSGFGLEKAQENSAQGVG